MAPVAAAIERQLRSGGVPSLAELHGVISIANAITNGDGLNGENLRDNATEAWQAASLLSGKMIVDEFGGVVDASGGIVTRAQQRALHRFYDLVWTEAIRQGRIPGTPANSTDSHVDDRPADRAEPMQSK